MAAGKTLYANEDRRPKIKRTGEQVDIHITQCAGDSAQHDHGNQQDRYQTAPLFWRPGRSGTVRVLLSVGIVVSIVFHKRTSDKKS